MSVRSSSDPSASGPGLLGGLDFVTDLTIFLAILGEHANLVGALALIHHEDRYPHHPLTRLLLRRPLPPPPRVDHELRVTVDAVWGPSDHDHGDLDGRSGESRQCTSVDRAPIVAASAAQDPVDHENRAHPCRDHELRFMIGEGVPGVPGCRVQRGEIVQTCLNGISQLRHA